MGRDEFHTAVLKLLNVSDAEDDSSVLWCLENAIKRSACLDVVEYQTGSSWGDDPDVYTYYSDINE